MALLHRIAFLIVLTTCLFQQHCYRLIARSNQGLISRVCAKTSQNRDLCLDCFRVPPEKPNQGIKGLAQVSIFCSSSASFSSKQVVEELGKNSTRQLAQNCFTCVRDMNEMLVEFIDAGKDVEAERYGDGMNHLNQAHNRALNCLNLVESSKVAELTTVKGDIEVAISVVNEIPI